MSRIAHFRVDPKLAHVLGESYTSGQQALKEPVDNAWDAVGSQKEEGKMKKLQTTRRLPLPHSSFLLLPSKAPIIVQDNGSGMKTAQSQSLPPSAPQAQGTHWNCSYRTILDHARNFTHSLIWQSYETSNRT